MGFLTNVSKELVEEVICFLMSMVAFKWKMQKNLRSSRKLYTKSFLSLRLKNLESALTRVKKLVNDYDKELTGKAVEAHFIIVEVFENQKEKGDEE